MEVDDIIRLVEPISLLSRDRLMQLCVFSQKVAHLAGDMAEVGVYQGGSCLLLAKANPHKIIHAFDTFSGIPNATSVDGHFNGDFNNLDVRSTVRILEDAAVHVHRGYFPITAAGLTGPYCFAHFDGDTYISCKDFLEYFWPRLTVGGVLMFDDFESIRCPGIARAISEFYIGVPATFAKTVPHQCVLTKEK
jgi:O-methyltransferase